MSSEDENGFVVLGEMELSHTHPLLPMLGAHQPCFDSAPPAAQAGMDSPGPCPLALMAVMINITVRSCTERGLLFCHPLFLPHWRAVAECPELLSFFVCSVTHEPELLVCVYVCVLSPTLSC